MSEATMKAKTQEEMAPERVAPKPRVADLNRALRLGLLGGVTAIFISAVGMVETFSRRDLIQPFITLGYTALFLVPIAYGYLAGKAPPEIEGLPPEKTGPRNVVAGLIAGSLTGVLTSAFILFANAINLRPIFPSVSPRMLDLLTFNLDIELGILVLTLGCLVSGGIAAALAIAPAKWRRPLDAAVLWTLLVALLEGVFQQVLRGVNLQTVNNFLFSPLGGLKSVGAVLVFLLVFGIYTLTERKQMSMGKRFQDMSEGERRPYLIGGVVLLVMVVAVVPQIIGVFNSEVLDIVAIFLLMGLGLNIVVGFAGLLDLGYVAFFAVGAYTTAVLTSASSPFWSPELTFWAALPFVVIAAAFAGILVGTPVLRMRGDYLAIVTLGFGEIARFLFISEWLFPYVGGAQGIVSIPKIQVGPFVAQTPPQLFYPLAFFVLVAIYISWALKNSRIGRAWMAMREDEPVAEVIGIDIVNAKLSAFIMGAILAGVGGAVFATKLGSIFPHSFNVVISIQVLVLIIVGGMGSIPGVIVGALVIIGLPELLREFAEFKFLFYGALLIYMMLNKPEGFIPTQERMRELHQEEMLQDAWLMKEQEERETPADTPEAEPDVRLTGD